VDDELRNRECAGGLVIWSNDTLTNAIVIDEANLILRYNKILFAVLLEDVRPPLGFQNTPRVDLTGWDGTVTTPDIAAVPG
jgi:hypothetical protein